MATARSPQLKTFWYVAVASLVAMASCDTAESRSAAQAFTRTDSWTQLRDSTGVSQLSDDPKMCSTCIGFSELAVLGGPADSGDSYVEAAMNLLRDSRGNYWVTQGRNLKVFGPGGQFLRSVGRPGSGPMEWGRPWPISSDSAGNVHIVDLVNARETIVGPVFKRISDHPIAAIEINAVVARDTDTYLVNAWGTSPEQVGEPLHVMRGRETLMSFGAAPTAVALTPLNSRRVIAMDREGRAFAMGVEQYEIEVWTRDGKRILGLVGPTLNRAPSKPGPYTRDDNPPPSQIGSIQVDDSGRLWVLSRRVKPGWQDLFEDHLYPNGRRGLALKKGAIIDSIGFSRVEVIDLARRLIVARTDRPGLLFGWAGPGLVWQTGVNREEKPAIRIWRIGITGGGSRP